MPLRFPPAEYPSLLRGLKNVGPQHHREWGHLLEKHEVIFDIGANIGVTVHHFFAMLNGTCRIWAFEPIPRNFELLETNARALQSDQVVVVNCAVGDHDGEVVIYDNVEHGALSRLDAKSSASPPKSAAFWKQYREIRIEMITLDRFVQERVDTPPTFLKIDVEGAGTMVLEGAKQVLTHHHPAINCEFHTRHEREGVTRIAREAGYRGVRFPGGGKVVWCEPEEAGGNFLHPADPRGPRVTPE